MTALEKSPPNPWEPGGIEAKDTHCIGTPAKKRTTITILPCVKPKVKRAGWTHEAAIGISPVCQLLHVTMRKIHNLANVL